MIRVPILTDCAVCSYEHKLIYIAFILSLSTHYHCLYLSHANSSLIFVENRLSLLINKLSIVEINNAFICKMTRFTYISLKLYIFMLVEIMDDKLAITDIGLLKCLPWFVRDSLRETLLPTTVLTG
jgi:hypothetical protein